jgi:protein-tyrosine phosphatase
MTDSDVRPPQVPDSKLFAILFVCTGNIHRSATAERLTQERARAHSPLSVTSAGVQAVVGHSIATESADAIRALGGNADDHQARQLHNELILKADLILVAEVVHRTRILESAPASMRKTFTFIEFLRLAQQVSPIPAPGRRGLPAGRDDLLIYVTEVAAQRGVAAPPQGPEDIRDPVGRGVKAATETVNQIAQLVDAMLDGFGLR